VNAAEIDGNKKSRRSTEETIGSLTKDRVNKRRTACKADKQKKKRKTTEKS